MEDTVTTNVIKRNGEEVHFDRAKIVNAITKANGNVERIHQMNPYQIEAIADTIRPSRSGDAARGECGRHPGYGRDQHYGDAWL